MESSSGSRTARSMARQKVRWKEAPKDSVLLAMLPDTGERYLSTPLFEGVETGSDDEWLAGL